MGAGGIGVSALIKLALDRGAIVTGCDLKKNSTTEQLNSQNVSICLGHSPTHIPGQDILVYSTAVPQNNLELQAARDAGIECLPRSAMLRILQQGCQLIGVTGSHGKTTTTGLIAHILIKSNYDPSVALGGLCLSLEDKNFRIGNSKWFVSELDESDGSMLDCSPEVGVITNIDREHVEHYGSMDQLKKAFYEFVDCVSDTGCLVICNDDPLSRQLADDISENRKIFRYGLSEGSHYCARDIRYHKDATEFFLITKNNSYPVTIPLLGEHNVLNCMAALATAEFAGIPLDVSISHLKDYKTVKRRLDVLYNGGPIIIDDYAHHPREIIASLKGVKSLGCKKIVAVFQAHRYTRLKDLWPDFLDALMIPDEVIVCDIYSANEEPIEGVSADHFARELLSKGKTSVQYISKFENVMDYLRSILNKDDLLITLGAGDVNTISKNLAIEYIKR